MDPSQFEIEDTERDLCWYKDHFHGQEHTVYLGGDEDSPLFLAVNKSNQESPPYPFTNSKTNRFDSC
jgi:hypothetical protein